MGSGGYPASPRSAWEQSSRAFERLSTLLREVQDKSGRTVQLQAACSDLEAENKELRGEVAAGQKELEAARKRGAAAGGEEGVQVQARRKAQVWFVIFLVNDRFTSGYDATP